MFDDVTYLKLFVSTTAPWESIIKKAYSRREINKAELNKRIAFTVVSGSRGLIQQYKENMFIEYSDSLSSYEHEDWVSLYQEIKDTDKLIVSQRETLKKLPYITPEHVLTDIRSIWSFTYLTNEWQLQPGDAAEEISLYGSTNIERFAKATARDYIRNKGRYHFVRALHTWANDKVIDLPAFKEAELKSLAYLN